MGTELNVSIAVAIIAAIAAIISAALSYLSSRRSSAHAEVMDLRNRVEDVEATNQKLWVYCRKLIDHIYRGLGPPPPLPDDLESLFPKEKS